MRWSLLLLLVAIPTLAFAEPKVAVAPLDGDDGKVADAVGELVGEHAKVTRPARVESAMKGMGASVLSPKTARKLRTKLDVDVVIYGSVEKDGGEKHLSLTFAGSAKEKPTLDVTFKSTKQLEKTLGKKLKKRIDSAMEGSDGDQEEDEEDARAKKEEERRQRDQEEADRKKREEEERKREEEAKRKEEERRKKEEEDERRAERDRKKRDDEDRKKHRNDDDEDDEGSGRKRRASRDDDDRKKRDRDDDRKKRDRDDEESDRDRKKRDRDDDETDRDRKKKRVADEDEDSSTRRRLDDDEDERDRGDEDDGGRRRRHRREHRHVLSHAALFADAGGGFARRTFTYDAAGTMRPPPVGTAAVQGRFAVEAYPGSFSTLKGPAAGVGLAFDGAKTVGLGIKVPGTAITVPIKQGQYSIGARYRFAFGDNALAIGAGFWRRYYIADRSKLMSPDQLDMPDVEYSAFAPVVELHVGAGPKIDAFGSFDFPLMYKTGPIQNPNNNYGAAKILAFDLRGGTQIMVASHMALQIAADFDQVGLSFTQQPGSKSVLRMVSKATDRVIGLSATLGITY